MIMKKFFIILLSVFLVGCTANTADYDTAVETVTEDIKEDMQMTADSGAVEPASSKNTVTEEPESGENAEDVAASEQTVSAESSQEQAASEDIGNQTEENAGQTVKSQDTTTSKSEKSDNSGTSAKTDSSDEKKKTESSDGNDKSGVAQKEDTQPEPVSYSPDSVVSLAIAKCQAGGMITTTDNLANLLADGSITQEEYDEYYPYDGLGYYSVFVETDLNEAATTSGKKLESEEAIAQYLADMLLLETEPIFNIEYAGITKTGGTDYYEFRCYR